MRALLINPWIYDFAAYDLWMKPLGLLRVASILRSRGWTLDYIDCLDRSYPHQGTAGHKPGRNDKYGCGKFPKTEVEKPPTLAQVKRPHFRYGIPLKSFTDQLSGLEKPDLILVGSTMTYWYPGPFLALRLTREFYPETPSVLGGIYPRLCPEHALRFSGATRLHTGGGLAGFHRILAELGLGDSPPYSESEARPAFDLISDRSALVLQTSRGCPFSCSYCAAGILEPVLKQEKPEKVARDIQYYIEEFGTTDFAFYDNALLFRPELHLNRILSILKRKNISLRFHAPNGLHARFLGLKTAFLMKESGFTTIRLSLETSQSERQKITGAKVANEDLLRALKHLKKAGFKSSDIGVYLLAGLPGQSPEEVQADIFFIHEQGAKIYLASYSPIPGTRDYSYLTRAGVIEDGMDPLWQNNTIFFLRQRMFSLDSIRDLRQQISALNQRAEAC